MKIAENNIVELTWWDEFDSREHVEISVHTEYDDCSGDVWISVDDLTLSLDAWENLMYKIKEIIEIGGLQYFIDTHKVIKDEIKVLSRNRIKRTIATK